MELPVTELITMEADDQIDRFFSGSRRVLTQQH